MTDAELREKDGILCRYRRLYSVDMQGNDRIDYGDGEILVIDREKKILIFDISGNIPYRPDRHMCCPCISYPLSMKDHPHTVPELPYRHILYFLLNMSQ